MKLFNLQGSHLQPFIFPTSFFFNTDQHILFMMASNIPMQLLHAFPCHLPFEVIVSPLSLHPVAVAHYRRPSAHPPPHEEKMSFNALSLLPFEKSLPCY